MKEMGRWEECELLSPALQSVNVAHRLFRAFTVQVM